MFENGNSVEDPFLWWEGDHFELIGKDMTGGICGECFAGIHACSNNGLDWELCDDPSQRLISVTSVGATVAPQCEEG